MLYVVSGRAYKALGATLVTLMFLVPVLGYSFYIDRDRQQVRRRQHDRPVALRARLDIRGLLHAQGAGRGEQLCPVEPLGQRRSPDYYAHTLSSPLYKAKIPADMTLDQLETEFAKAAMTQQPWRLTGAVLHDASRLFTWNHDNLSNPDAPTERWRFQTDYPVYPTAVYYSTVQEFSAHYGDAPPHLNVGVAAFMRAYQLTIGFTPGPVMALFLIVALAGVCRRGRSTGAPTRASALLYLVGAVAVLGSADFYEFTWRYQLPGLVLIPLAGVLGWTAFTWRPAPAPFPEPADDEMIEAFFREYGEISLPPVAVVIAAYNESAGIGSALDAMPATTGEADPLDIATIVVVDGGTDDTAAIARKHDVYVCELPQNRGQGAALRLGYYLARRGGAQYIVTSDADGQYESGQLHGLLEPIRSGEADFVIGSRRLRPGDDHSRDIVRRTGVRVFGFIISVLTGTWVTDTSSGFRAFRAEVSANVTLNQPQYQTSEFLISALSHGYRVVERPVTMRKRIEGKSKKGNNLQFGTRYARVVFSTWARERVARRERGEDEPVEQQELGHERHRVRAEVGTLDDHDPGEPGEAGVLCVHRAEVRARRGQQRRDHRNHPVSDEVPAGALALGKPPRPVPVDEECDQGASTERGDRGRDRARVEPSDRDRQRQRADEGRNGRGGGIPDESGEPRSAGQKRADACHHS